ncbi:hypothetical protein BT63DRAFT_422706 [Microthyrium microscopicum]|uniref:Zn(2)-C6 fungal-type domain-containing protein n=1 Tax=Microthyrium microscopicum TaxID=703497 RepID=A0A6A6UMA0_9PEZI|nr:hypothetical protein BT63DRAFT_422706 [Microthyrium microscopicum]
MSSSLPTSRTPSRNAVVKRQKIRKGTFSCWECKHRKIRCVPNPASSVVCTSCHSRGLVCIGQEFPDPDNVRNDAETRIDHLESMVTEVIQQRTISGARPQDCWPASKRSIGEGRWPSQQLLAIPLYTESSMAGLSGHLHSIFPRLSTIDQIIRYSGPLKLAVHVLYLTKKQYSASNNKSSDREEQTITLSSPTDHPIKFARKLIQLALCLQQLNAASVAELSRLQLGGPVHDIMRHYANAVSRYVTSQDDLVNCLEGLEVLMLEALFKLNEGSTRAAWLLFRRCIAIAQMLGYPNSRSLPEQRLWFCFILADRTLSLMLGLPFVVVDDEFVNERLIVVSSPAQKLDCWHVLIMGRIIARNLRIQRRRRSPQNQGGQTNGIEEYQETQSIDAELKKVARLVPSSWWNYKDLDNSLSEVEMAERTAIILAQMHHHFLVVILHQTYLLWDAATYNETYCKSAVLYASREMLSRFLALRKFHVGPTYRGLDNKALISSITLLVVHLQGHEFGAANMFEHQRPRDLALIDQIIKSLEKISVLYNDKSSKSYAQMLKELMKVEDDAAHGANYSITIEDDNHEMAKEEGRMALPIAYFGTISVTHVSLASTRLANRIPEYYENENHFSGQSTLTSGSDPFQYLLESSGDSDFTAAGAHEALNLSPLIDFGMPELNEVEDMSEFNSSSNIFQFSS